MTNYTQQPVDNGGNPYFPDGKVNTDKVEDNEETEGVVKEIMSINTPLDYFNDFYTIIEGTPEVGLKAGFANSIVIMYMEEMGGFVGYVKVGPNGELGEPTDINQVNIEDYNKENNVFLMYSSSTQEIAKVYTLKGNTPSDVTVLGQEKLPFAVQESEVIEEDDSVNEDNNENRLYPYDVNPCYAGAYMYKADNTSVLYKVDNEGKLIPYAKMNDYLNPVESLYYKGTFDTVKPLNPYNDVIFYYLPNGSIVDKLKMKSFHSL